MQTNQTYTYQIPKHLREIIAVGSRIIVPFGHRKVQGFVVELTDESAYDGKLKKVEQVVDPEPVLSGELVELGKDLARETFSFQISCYLTMLPASLRADYKKWVRLKKSTAATQEIFENEEKLAWEVIEDQQLENKIAELRQQGLVTIDYEITDKRTVKTADYFKPTLSAAELLAEKEKLPQNATRQLQLLEMLENNDQTEYVLKDLRENQGIERTVIKAAVAKGWGELIAREIYRNPYQDKKVVPTSPLTLNEEQQKSYDAITQAMATQQETVFLLEGVTGSGKTEVYLQAIAKALDQGQGALMLVPEIALTPQMAYRFKSRFGEQVAVLHSALSEGEKYDEWRRIKNKEARVVVGARSSVFAPLTDIGLIVIDEEHENSYKQEEHPRYHTRDVAIWRGRYHHCPVVLGSATPSLESRARASKGVYKHLTLTQRATAMPLPPVQVVDMRDELQAGNFTIFSRPLAQRLNEVLARHEQAVLLLNRRGFAHFAMCRNCGYKIECPNCDISLTHHLQFNQLKCHYCGYETSMPTRCPQCGSDKIRSFGTGTQKVEKQLQSFLPHARILRMDVDTTRRKGAHERILSQFGRYEADILLGTQMIAKGLDFERVTFVGVLNADTALSFPDFRSAEKTFQLLTQVSGRAGRGDRAGSVVIQTYNPEHYAIQLVQRHDYEKFYLEEMNFRHMAQYSPYYFMIKVEVSHKQERQAAQKAQEIARYLRKYVTDEAIILGPSPNSIARINKHYHFQLIIKYKHEPQLQKCLHHILENSQKDYQKGLRLTIDNQPLSFM